MATGSYMTPIYSRSQSEVQGDLHKSQRTKQFLKSDEINNLISTGYSSKIRKINLRSSDLLQRSDTTISG
ncbi:hypothetical protein TNCV_2994401 [Trichonephila clavipes]|nr:hypothetical protein TNCV_2994401 [Trichonephila clavipes]